MKKITHTLSYLLELPLSREQVFEFFSDAANLERITPPELNFSIMTPLPIAMGKGRLIDYRLSLFGVPFSWKTEITEWNPPDMFIDRQIEGPYAEWVHCHRFTESDEGNTLIHDDVTYRLPLYPVGEMAFPVVKAQLERIFSYRCKAVREILSGKI